MRSEEGPNAIPYAVRGLRCERPIPVIGSRNTLVQIPGTRGSVKVGMTGALSIASALMLA